MTHIATTWIDHAVDAVASVSAGPLPDSVVEVARRRVLDTVCATRIGRLTPDGRALASAVPGYAPLERIIVAVGSCRATEMDDIHPGGCVTAGAIAVPTGLVLGERLGADDATVLRAVVAGYEVAVLLGRGLGGPDALARDVWPTYVCAGVIAASVGAVLHGCDRGTTRRALTLAAAGGGGSAPSDEPGLPARWLAVGMAAASGVLALGGALAGIHAETPGRSGDGAASILADAVCRARSSWEVAEVETKPIASARQALAPLQALLTVVEAGASRRKPAHVELRVPPAFREMLDAPAQDRWGSLVSLHAQVPLALADPARLHDPVRAAGWRAGDGSSPPVTVTADPSLEPLLPERWGGRARVEWAGGGFDEATVTDAEIPTSWNDLERKWRSTIAAVAPDDDEWLDDALVWTRGLGSEAAASRLREVVAVMDLAMEPEKEETR